MQLNGTALPIFPPKPADPSLRPADALLRESTAGQSQYSPTTQHQQIVAAMAKHGYYPACIDGDEQRGRVTSRPGYQRIKARVARGLTEAVFVFHSSRLGRDASERLALQRELKKLRVPIFSAQQGEIRADLIGGVYALMDEQFSIDLAYKIKNAMPSAVKNGLYPARTPVGYKRVWPQDQAYARKSRPEMVPDERYGPLVQDIFRKFGYERWTIRMIVRWLNTQVATLPNPDSERGLWTIGRIARMLRNPIYAGQIVWGKTKSGYYDSYDGPVLRSGEGDVEPARHVALIDPDLWKAVQMRLHHEDERRLPYARRERTPALLSGTLVCRACGTAMHLKAGSGPGGRQGAQYVCGARARGLSTCAEPSCIAAHAEAAVLREVARLRAGRPWTPAAVDEMAAHDPHAAERAALEAEVAVAQRELDAGIQALTLAAQAGPLPERTLERFHTKQQELDRRITALQARLEALPRTAVEPVDLSALHARLATTDLAGLIARAQADGDVPALRELLTSCVASAVIVERVRGARSGRTGWLRAKVEWTPAVDLFLEHGYLLRGAAPEAPPAPPSLSPAERARRLRARRRAERDAALGPDLLTLPQAAAELGLSAAGLRSALRRGTLTVTHVPERPGRPVLERGQVERYRAERLGKRGRKPR